MGPCPEEVVDRSLSVGTRVWVSSARRRDMSEVPSDPREVGPVVVRGSG